MKSDCCGCCCCCCLRQTQSGLHCTVFIFIGPTVCLTVTLTDKVPIGTAAAGQRRGQWQLVPIDLRKWSPLFRQESLKQAEDSNSNNRQQQQKSCPAVLVVGLGARARWWGNYDRNCNRAIKSTTTDIKGREGEKQKHYQHFKVRWQGAIVLRALLKDCSCSSSRDTGASRKRSMGNPIKAGGRMLWWRWWWWWWL